MPARSRCLSEAVTAPDGGAFATTARLMWWPARPPRRADPTRPRTTVVVSRDAARAGCSVRQSTTGYSQIVAFIYLCGGQVLRVSQSREEIENDLQRAEPGVLLKYEIGLPAGGGQ